MRWRMVGVTTKFAHTKVVEKVLLGLAGRAIFWAALGLDW